MDIWSTLGIEPTYDLSVIKKAYARKLKIHHPEEDPQGYQMLREAYDAAVRYVKKREEGGDQKNKNDIEYAKGLQLQALVATSTKEEHSVEVYDINTDKYKQNEAFMRCVEDLYNNFYQRIEQKNWELILDCNAVWDISNRDNLGHMLLDFLENHHYLPQNIWKVLDNNFNWSEQEVLSYEHDEEFIKYINRQVTQARSLSYTYIKGIDNIDIEMYLGYRENAFFALEEDDLDAAYSYMKKAKEMYPLDLDLLHIEGDYHIQKGRLEEAASLIKDLLQNNPNDINGIYCIARIHYVKKEFFQAAKAYQRLQEEIPNNLNLIFIIAKCYIELKDYETSRDYLLRILEMKGDSTEARRLLVQLSMHKKSKLVRQFIINPLNTSLSSQIVQLKEEIKQHLEFLPQDKHIEEVYRKSLIKSFIAIVLAVLLYGFFSFISDMDINTELVGNMDITAVASHEELKEMFPLKDWVRLDISNAMELSLYNIYVRNLRGTPELFLGARLGNINSSVYVGIFDDRLMVFVSEDSLRFNSPASISFTGNIKEMPDISINIVKQSLRDGGILPEFYEKLNTDYYIMVDEDNYIVTEQPMNVLLFIKSYWYFLIPLLMLINAFIMYYSARQIVYSNGKMSY